MTKEVIFISGRDPLTIRGGDTDYVRAHARAALATGFAPHIFSVAPRRAVIATEFGTVHRVASPFRPYRFLMAPAHGPLMAAAIARFLEGREPPYLLHGFDVWAYSGVMVARRLRRVGRSATLIVSSYTTRRHESHAKRLGARAHHGWPARAQHWWEDVWTRGVVVPYERAVYAESDLILVNYASVERMLRAEFGDGLPIRHLSYSTEPAFTAAESESAEPPTDLLSLAPADAPLIVSVSRHDSRKGLDVLLRALAELRQAGVPFRACLVGWGQLLEAHRRLAARLSLGATTALVGWVPDPAAYLRHADIFVLPSTQEASGSLSLIEALRWGVAVVASNVDGIPEDVTDGDSALLVEPGNAAALSGALARALGDATLRGQLRRRAREIFAERFSAPTFTEALRGLYAELGFAAAPEQSR